MYSQQKKEEQPYFIVCVDDKTGQLNWPILEHRRYVAHLAMFYKVATRLAAVYNIRPPDEEEDTTGPTNSTPVTLT